MQIHLQDGTEVDLDEAAIEARKMVSAAMMKRREEHHEQINRLVEAVFITAAQAEVKSEINRLVSAEVARYFSSKAGKAAVAEAAKSISDRAIADMLCKPD